MNAKDIIDILWAGCAVAVILMITYAVFIKDLP